MRDGFGELILVTSLFSATTPLCCFKEPPQRKKAKRFFGPCDEMWRKKHELESKREITLSNIDPKTSITCC